MLAKMSLSLTLTIKIKINETCGERNNIILNQWHSCADRITFIRGFTKPAGLHKNSRSFTLYQVWERKTQI